MAQKLDKSWHLAKTDLEIMVTEFEILLWRISAAFVRWQIDATKCVSKNEMTGYDIAILHIIRLKDRPKTLYDVAKLLNREDTTNISYSLRKLIKYGLVKKSGPKQSNYEITKAGIKETDAYTEVKRTILIERMEELAEQGFDFKPLISGLSTLTGTYDEASRVATTYMPK